MGDPRAWAESFDRAVGGLGSSDIRVDPWRRSGGGSWSTSFETFIGDWKVWGKAEFGRTKGVEITSITVDWNPFSDLDMNNLPVSGGAVPARERSSSGISNEILRQIPLARIKDAVQRTALQQPQFDRLFSALGPENRVPTKKRRANRALAAQAAQKGVTGRGRPRLGASHWREFSLTALRFYREGKRPLRSALSREFGVSEETIRDWMGRARTEGYLAETSGGRREVHPGLRLLKERRDKHE